jgi:phenylacetate-CoA ligase
VALVKAFGVDYDQIVLIGDPLFMKRLTDYALEQGLDWRRYRMNAVLGEETFGEHFRHYLERTLGLEPERPGGGHIMSSFGVGELGLHLCYETAATARLVRSSRATGWQPMILAYNPERTFIEVLEPDAEGYGKLTISMLDPSRQVPLLRYQTGDVARLLDGDSPMLALRGRVREALPNGSQVGLYKDVLYANHALARHFSGATRLIFSGDGFTMHVQLARGAKPAPELEQGLLQEVPAALRPTRLELWPYADFPFGMGLDYERKFQHYVADEEEPGNGQNR